MTTMNRRQRQRRRDNRRTRGRRIPRVPATARPSRPLRSADDRRGAAALEQEEPISLAEEIAAENRKSRGDAAHDRYEQIKQSGDTHIAELQRMSMAELIEEARKDNLTDYAGIKKQELIFRILKERVKLNGLMYGEGTLEVLPDGFGFLRSPDYHYLSCPDDIYVSPSQIRRFGLKTGTTVSGQIRPPKENERYFALLRVEAINYQDPNLLSSKVPFDELTPLHPDARIRMETTADEIEMRVVDMIVPIGFGQRGLIVSPPRAGKTILMQKMAKAALKNYPDLYVFMLLIDERPEEVTDMEREVKCAELRGRQLDLRRAGHAAHPGVGNGAGKGQADGRIRPRRADLPRFDHAAGPRVELGMSAVGQAALRRRRRQRPDPPQAVLRLRAEGRGGRLADRDRHRAGRHRQPHGRSDFRGVQGHRQPGDRAGPQAGRSPHLAVDRHQPQRHPQGRDADGSRGAPPGDDPPPRAERHEPARRHGTAGQPAAKDQDQRRVPDEHEREDVGAT